MIVKTLPCRSVNGIARPFPNLFWLVCPQLNEYISELEDRGWIDRFEKMMMDNPELMKKVEEAHVRTIEMRYAVARRYCLEYFASVLGKRGVGGTADHTRLKCLHLHVANYLGGIPNPIGKMAFNMIGKDWECMPGRVRCRVKNIHHKGTEKTEKPRDG